MQLNIKPLNYEDYDTTLLGWWNDWGWQVAPKRELLPANGIGGVMVYDGDVPVCAAFLYTTNSGIAWIDWIVSSKTYTNKKGRKMALNILVESLTNTAKNLGFNLAYSLSKSIFTQRVFAENGYVVSNAYNVEMIKVF
jgi:hypothetical protein